MLECSLASAASIFESQRRHWRVSFSFSIYAMLLFKELIKSDKEVDLEQNMKKNNSRFTW